MYSLAVYERSEVWRGILVVALIFAATAVLLWSGWLHAPQGCNPHGVFWLC